MGIFHFLIVVQGLIAAALVGVILMQRSEGGGLGTGGSPSGLMSARGAADFMTRTTATLGTLFILLSITLAFVAAQQGGGKLDEGFTRDQTPALGGTAPASAPAPADAAAKADAPAAPPAGTDVPLDQ
ncbi:MAG: preprotein translocase subunit SecG [Sphingorhabdus sp.]|nr:preprotein translocase subunit SecG [Sphingorhabdus sp.]